MTTAKKAGTSTAVLDLSEPRNLEASGAFANMQTQPQEALAPTPKLIKGARVTYKAQGNRKWRAAIVESIGRGRNSEGVKLWVHNGANRMNDENVHVTLVKDPSELPEADRPPADHWDALARYAEKFSKKTTVNYHEPLWHFLQHCYPANPRSSQNQLRVMSWNVKHFGAEHKKKPTLATAEARADPEERQRQLRELEQQQHAHDEERRRNLAEVILLSRASLVVLQEVSRTANLTELCRLLDERVVAADGLLPPRPLGAT